MIFKQLPNIKAYNRDGSKLDPFCTHEAQQSQQVIFYDYDVENDTEVELPLVGFTFWSNSLDIYVSSDSVYDEEDNFIGYNVTVGLGLNLTSSDNSLNINYNWGEWDNIQNAWGSPSIDITSNLDVRSDDASVSVISKTDSITNAQYFDLSVSHPSLPSVQSSNETIDVDYNSTTKVYDVKSDLRSDDSSVNITQKTDGQTGKKYLDLSVSVPSVPTLQSSNDSINIDYDSVNNQYDATLDVRSDNTTIYVKQKTDANTNKSYLNIDVIKAEAQSLMTSGLRATGFSINYYYARYTPQGESSEKILGWKVAQNSYVPLFRIFAHNNGKASIMFEIIGREDTFGYYAKYYFSSRIQNAVYYPEGISATHYPAGMSGSTYTDDQNQTRTYPYNYYFMGNCEMVASERADVFDPSDIVVVECGSNSSNGLSETGSVYMIYKKIRQAPAPGTLSNDFFAVNTLCYDKPGYCDIQFYFCSEPVHKYTSTSLFPATGNPGELYVDTTNKKVYKWDTSSNAYAEYENDFNYRLFDDSFIPFEAVLSSPSAPFTTVGLTTFTDRLTGETKNIADYAVSATFPSNNP